MKKARLEPTISCLYVITSQARDSQSTPTQPQTKLVTRHILSQSEHSTFLARPFPYDKKTSSLVYTHAASKNWK